MALWQRQERQVQVAAGLGQLSPALESLAEPLRIDRDLLYVAAEASMPLRDTCAV